VNTVIIFSVTRAYRQENFYKLRISTSIGTDTYFKYSEETIGSCISALSMWHPCRSCPSMEKSIFVQVPHTQQAEPWTPPPLHLFPITLITPRVLALCILITAWLT